MGVEMQRIEDGEAGEVQPYQFILGQGDAIPDIEEAIKSLEVEGSGEFVVCFPDDFPNEERRGPGGAAPGQAGTLGSASKCRSWDADLAKSLGDFEGRRRLEGEDPDRFREGSAGNKPNQWFGESFWTRFLEANPFTVPVSMVGPLRGIGFLAIPRESPQRSWPRRRSRSRLRPSTR